MSNVATKICVCVLSKSRKIGVAAILGSLTDFVIVFGVWEGKWGFPLVAGVAISYDEHNITWGKTCLNSCLAKKTKRL